MSTKTKVLIVICGLLMISAPILVICLAFIASGGQSGASSSASLLPAEQANELRSRITAMPENRKGETSMVKTTIQK